MASGDLVGHIIALLFPGSDPATIDIRAGGSTPTEQVEVYDFDAATAEYLDIKIALEGYGGGGLTITLIWSASSATSGVTVWRAAFRRMADDAEDIDASHSYTFNSVNATAPSASGEVAYDDITFTDGADMDSVADGELAILRIGRDAANGSDTMTGDAELWAVIVKET